MPYEQTSFRTYDPDFCNKRLWWPTLSLSFTDAFQLDRSRRACPPLSPPVASQSGLTGWATGRGEAQVTTASAVFWAPVHFHFHLMSRRDHRAVTRVKAFNISLSRSVCCSRGFVSLISARTIWADGWVRAWRNGKPPSAEWDLAFGPMAPWGRAIKVEPSWANSWQEQELIAGQGREKQIHTDTLTHPHGVEGGTAKQGQKTLGNTNVATHDLGGVRDQIGTGQKDIWNSSIIIHYAAVVGESTRLVGTLFSWLDISADVYLFWIMGGRLSFTTEWEPTSRLQRFYMNLGQWHLERRGKKNEAARLSRVPTQSTHRRKDFCPSQDFEWMLQNCKY